MTFVRALSLSLCASLWAAVPLCAQDASTCDGGACETCDAESQGDDACDADAGAEAGVDADAGDEALPDSDEPRPDGKSLVGCRASGGPVTVLPVGLLLVGLALRSRRQGRKYGTRSTSAG